MRENADSSHSLHSSEPPISEQLPQSKITPSSNQFVAKLKRFDSITEFTKNQRNSEKSLPVLKEKMIKVPQSLESIEESMKNISQDPKYSTSSFTEQSSVAKKVGENAGDTFLKKVTRFDSITRKPVASRSKISQPPAKLGNILEVGPNEMDIQDHLTDSQTLYPDTLSQSSSGLASHPASAGTFIQKITSHDSITRQPKAAPTVVKDSQNLSGISANPEHAASQFSHDSSGSNRHSQPLPSSDNSFVQKVTRYNSFTRKSFQERHPVHSSVTNLSAITEFDPTDPSVGQTARSEPAPQNSMSRLNRSQTPTSGQNFLEKVTRFDSITGKPVGSQRKIHHGIPHNVGAVEENAEYSNGFSSSDDGLKNPISSSAAKTKQYDSNTGKPTSLQAKRDQSKNLPFIQEGPQGNLSKDDSVGNMKSADGAKQQINSITSGDFIKKIARYNSLTGKPVAHVQASSKKPHSLPHVSEVWDDSSEYADQMESSSKQKPSSSQHQPASNEFVQKITDSITRKTVNPPVSKSKNRMLSQLAEEPQTFYTTRDSVTENPTSLSNSDFPPNNPKSFEDLGDISFANKITRFNSFTNTPNMIPSNRGQFLRSSEKIIEEPQIVSDNMPADVSRHNFEALFAFQTKLRVEKKLDDVQSLCLKRLIILKNYDVIQASKEFLRNKDATVFSNKLVEIVIDSVASIVR